MSALAVTDTHALIWFATGHTKKLGRAARRLFERVDAGRGALYVPIIVVVELLEAERRGVVRMAGGVEGWIAGMRGASSYFVVDLSMEIVLAAQRLYAIPERSDRLIAATAVTLGLPLVTRDPAIADASAVAQIW